MPELRFEDGPPLEVSSVDHRSYRAFTLPNQLAVLIASDPISDKAAAALDVAVGNFSDPDEIPGLAHFLEHMLFLGTEKYPDEGSYNEFLSENGGHSNAYTACENTNYHFEMVVSDKEHSVPQTGSDDVAKFKEALDRFSQFFTAPLFTESATDRELNAVHSEHEKNLQSDTRRIYQLKKQISNPAHPYSRFGTGSKETLFEVPRDKNIDVRAALLDFHAKYYSANLMKLCITGPYALDLMQEWVVELFSDIPNNDLSHPSEIYSDVSPLLDEHKGLIFYTETIKDIRQVELSWITPSDVKDYRSKSSRFIANMLGDEGEGSVLSLLKRRGWCDSLAAGLTDQKTFSVFQVSASLTTAGMDYIDHIVGLIFQYIRMLKAKGVEEWIYNEEKTLANNRFQFMESYDPSSFVTHIASSMHFYEPAEYLSGSYLYKRFDPDKIRDFLDLLTPQNGNVVIAGKFTSAKTSEKERWYKTPFHVEKASPEVMAKWLAVEHDPMLDIPAANPFVPTELELLCEPLPEGVRDDEGPRVVFQNEYMEVHHKLDRTYKRPKAAMLILLSTPLVYRSPFCAVLANLFTLLLEDALSEYSYPAERAGFMFQLDQATTGLRLYIMGYNHRIDVLLSTVLRKITSLTVVPTRFAMQKDALERNYANFDMNQPYTRAMYNITYLLEEPRWHVTHYLDCIRDGSVTVDAMKSFVSELRERLHVTTLVCGNVSEKLAVSMSKSVQSIIGFKPLPAAEFLRRRVVQVPTGVDVYLRMPIPNSEDNNSAIEVFFQTGPRGDLLSDMKLELLGEILKKPAFHDLRTIQQLGYIVFEGIGETDCVRGLYVIVQSTVANPDDLLNRIDKFLTAARKELLETMSAERFQQFVSSLSANKAQPDVNMFEQTARFWKEMQNGFFLYDRSLQEIEVLQKLEVKDVLAFFDDFIAPGGSQRRRVISQIYGSAHPISDKHALPEDAIEVRNALAFRRRSPLYPVSGKHDVESDAKEFSI